MMPSRSVIVYAVTLVFSTMNAKGSFKELGSGEYCALDSGK